MRKKSEIAFISEECGGVLGFWGFGVQRQQQQQQHVRFPQQPHFPQQAQQQLRPALPPSSQMGAAGQFSAREREFMERFKQQQQQQQLSPNSSNALLKQLLGSSKAAASAAAAAASSGGSMAGSLSELMRPPSRSLSETTEVHIYPYS